MSTFATYILYRSWFCTYKYVYIYTTSVYLCKDLHFIGTFCKLSFRRLLKISTVWSNYTAWQPSSPMLNHHPQLPLDFVIDIRVRNLRVLMDWCWWNIWKSMVEGSQVFISHDNSYILSVHSTLFKNYIIIKRIIVVDIIIWLEGEKVA